MISIGESAKVTVIGGTLAERCCVSLTISNRSHVPLYFCRPEQPSDKIIAALSDTITSGSEKGWVIEGELGRVAIHSDTLESPDVIIDLDSSDMLLEDYLLLDHDTPQIWLHQQSAAMKLLMPIDD